VEVWGTGTTKREFIHADDLADACIFLMHQEECPEIINVGSGEAVTISELANILKDSVGYRGQLLYNPAKPDTTRSLLLDTSVLNNLGWQPKILLREGLKDVCHTYEHRQKNVSKRQKIVF